MTKVFIRVNDTQTETFENAKVKVNYEYDELHIVDENDESTFQGGFKQWLYWRYLPDLNPEPYNEMAQETFNFSFSDKNTGTNYIPPREQEYMRTELTDTTPLFLS